MTRKRISCIALDDEPKALEVIERHISKIPFLEYKRGFRDSMEALEWLDVNEVQLVFLDINMPKLSGIQFKKLIKLDILAIFTTAYSEFAVESYDLEALDYLVKPIEFDRLLKAVLKAKSRLAFHSERRSVSESQIENITRARFIYIKSGSKLHKIYIDDLLYLRKDGNYIWFYIKDKKVISRFSIGQAKELLPQEGFLQIHRSYIINLSQVEEVDHLRIKIGDQNIPVAKKYWKELMEKLGV